MGVRVEEIGPEGERVVRLKATSIPVAEAKCHYRLTSTGRRTKKTDALPDSFRPRARGGGRTDRGLAFHSGNPGAVAAHFRHLACGDRHTSAPCDTATIAGHRMHAGRFAITERGRRRDSNAAENIHSDRNDFGAGLEAAGKRAALHRAERRDRAFHLIRRSSSALSTGC